MVIFLFLRNLSATIIPSLALPMSIIGTFAVMHLLGYSIDKTDLRRLTYFPRGHGELEEDQFRMRKRILEIVEGRHHEADQPRHQWT